MLDKDDCQQFLKNYFNYNQCLHIIQPSENIFWGLTTNKMKKGSVKYRVIELIMKSQYFDGLSQIEERDRSEILYYCCEGGIEHFDFLSLMWKYCSKNELAISDGINYIGQYDDAPLMALLRQHAIYVTDYCVNLFLFEFGTLSEKCVISHGCLQSCFDFCKTVLDCPKWCDMIKNYCDQSHQIIDTTGRCDSHLGKGCELCPMIGSADHYCVIYQNQRLSEYCKRKGLCYERKHMRHHSVMFDNVNAPFPMYKNN